MLRFWRIAIHISALLIVAGALVTTFAGRRGYIHLRAGEGYASTWRLHDGTVLDLPFAIRLDSIDNTDPQCPATLSLRPAGTGTVSVSHSFFHKNYCLTYSVPDPDRGGYRFKVNHDRWGAPIVYAGYILMVLSFAGCWWCRMFSARGSCAGSKRQLWWLSVTAVILFVMIAIYIGTTWLGEGVSPMLRHPLLTSHVLLVMGGYALFGILCVCSVMRLAGKDINSRYITALLYGGLTFLSAGIAVGSVWAYDAWGSYWNWDPKETWALICMIVYLLPLHSRYFPIMRKPVNRDRYYALAILVVLFLWLGIEHYS